MSERRTRDPKRKRFVGAALAGLLAGSAATTALSIGSPAYAWLGWTSLITLLLVIRLLSPIAAALAGAFWGACLFIVCGCMVDSAVPRGIFSATLLASIPALYAYGGSIVARRGRFNPTFLLVLGWIGVEFALQPIVAGSGLLTGIRSGQLLLLPAGSVAGYALVALLVTVATVTVLSALSEARIVGTRPRRVELTTGGNQAHPLRERVVNYLAFLEPARPRPPPVAV